MKFVQQMRINLDSYGGVYQMRSKMNEQNRILWGYIIVFMFYFIMSYLTPLTMDDWVWGSSIGINRLQTNFNNYNGRYLGNLTIILLTRSRIIKCFFMAFINTGIIAFINKIVWNKMKNMNIFIIFILLSIMPLSISSQTYAWASGFSNYNMAAFFMLFNIVLFKNFIFSEDTKNKESKLSYILVILSGFFGQLFAEHVTIYNSLFSLCILVFSILKKEKIFKSLTFFISTSIGTFIMFSNSAYTSVAKGQDSYRTIEQNTDLFTRVYNVFTQYMYEHLVFNNTLLNIVLSISLIFTLTYFCKKSKTKNIFLIYLIVYPLYKLLVYDLFHFSFPERSHIINTINSLLSFSFIIIVGLSVLLFINKDRLKLLFFLISYIIVASPLFFVTPLSSRTFLSSYIFLVLFTLILIKNLMKEKNVLSLSEISSVFYGIVILLMGSYLVTFTHIYRSYEYRSFYIQTEIAKGEKEIKLWRIPNDQFIFGSTPYIDSYMEKNFKNFYNIPTYITFRKE